jgi:sugar phosphate isomerase/epimerase
MIQVGIFTGYLPYPLEETARRIRALNFNTVQLDVVFKDMQTGLGELDQAKCKKIRDTFRDYNLPVCCVSGYTNLVHPDPVKRKANIDRLKELLHFANELGSPYVISETGTFDADSDWVAHPKNKTEDGYQQCLDVIGELVQYARSQGAYFLVETYVNNVIGSVEEVLRLFSDINDDRLGLLMDPTNYFELHNIDKMDETLNSIFNALSSKVMMSHAKDVKKATDGHGVKMSDIDASEAHALRGVGMIELPAPGLGSLNYDLYLKRLSRDHPNIPVIIEHLEEEDIPRAKKFIDGKLKALGV